MWRGAEEQCHLLLWSRKVPGLEVKGDGGCGSYWPAALALASMREALCSMAALMAVVMAGVMLGPVERQGACLDLPPYTTHWK